MRGSDDQTASLFSYVSCEARAPANHPLRLIRAIVDEAPEVLSPGFDVDLCAGSTPVDRAGRNQERDWREQKRSKETHASVTDPDARLARKSNGQSSILAHAGHVMMENRSGLVARVCLTRATGTAERDAALAMIETLKPCRRITLGADKGYDAAAFITSLRELRVTPHVAVNTRVTKTGK